MTIDSGKLSVLADCMGCLDNMALICDANLCGKRIT
jgi:hypothetical protein